MIIGGEKGQVIQNIRQAVMDGDLNRKVELGDPALSAAQRRDVSMRCVQRMATPSYRLRNLCARTMEDIVGWTQNLDTQIVGLENLKGSARRGHRDQQSFQSAGQYHHPKAG